MEENASERAVNGARECKMPECNVVISEPRANQVFCGYFCKNNYHELERSLGKQILRKTDGGMHFCSMKSPRLIKMLDFLSDGEKHTSLEIDMAVHDCGRTTTIKELRLHGYIIESLFARTTAEGRKIWTFQLKGKI
jgi:hypothetical protein